jgi:hypothetical protein
MWDGRRRDGGTNSTLRIKEQEKRLTLNEHDDDDDDNEQYVLGYIKNTVHCFNLVKDDSSCFVALRGLEICN